MLEWKCVSGEPLGVGDCAPGGAGEGDIGGTEG